MLAAARAAGCNLRRPAPSPAAAQRAWLHTSSVAEQRGPAGGAVQGRASGGGDAGRPAQTRLSRTACESLVSALYTVAVDRAALRACGCLREGGGGMGQSAMQEGMRQRGNQRRAPASGTRLLRVHAAALLGTPHALQIRQVRVVAAAAGGRHAAGLCRSRLCGRSGVCLVAQHAACGPVSIPKLLLPTSAVHDGGLGQGEALLERGEGEGRVRAAAAADGRLPQGRRLAGRWGQLGASLPRASPPRLTGDVAVAKSMTRPLGGAERGRAEAILACASGQGLRQAADVRRPGSRCVKGMEEGSRGNAE